METINNGGPAFPKTGRVSSENRRMEDGQVGMTLRDYFAAKAMAVFANDHLPRKAAELAFAYADEMIAMRNRGA